MDDASLSPEPDASQAIDEDLGRIVQFLEPQLGRLDGSLAPLGGGITNRNYRGRFGETDYVIRVPGKDTELLGIDRAAEYEANRVAADIGIAAPVAAMLVHPACIVTEFIEGREMKSDELGDADALSDVADALRTMHAGPAIPSRFDSFRVAEEYARVALNRGAEIPPEYNQAVRRAREIEGALSGPEHAPVPCHNDLLAANFIHDGRRVRIVDWEYAGMGNRYFDLANFAVNNELGERAREGFLELYFHDRPSPRQIATLHLFTFMSDFREAMWGIVQTKVSDIDFDFAGYANKHFERLAKLADSDDFDRSLETARGDQA